MSDQTGVIPPMPTTAAPQMAPAAETVIDFNKLMGAAGSGTFEALPAGDYVVKVASTEATRSANGKPMIKVKYTVEGGPSAGRPVFNQHVISADNPNALAFFFQHMAAYGLDRNYFASNPPMPQVAAAMVGRVVQVTLEVRDYQGAPRNNVTKLIAAAGMMAMPGAPVAAAPVMPVAPAPVPPVAAPAPVAPAAVVPPVAPPVQVPDPAVVAAVAAPAPVQPPPGYMFAADGVTLVLIPQQPAPAPVQPDAAPATVPAPGPAQVPNAAAPPAVPF
jgi:hypothetical protein